MFIIKLMKHGPASTDVPIAIEGVSIHEADAVHVRYEPDRRTVLQIGNAPRDTLEVTIGSRSDCSYNVAYIMNAETGRTVETIR